MTPSALPPQLPMEAKQEKAIDVARMLDGLCVSDAIEILETARWFVSRASVALPALIPPKCDEPRTERLEGVSAVESGE